MDRTRTGIAELDQMLSGGFMPGDAVMVGGSAGTGKSTLALQYLVNGITQFGENGIYITFEQLPDQIYRDAKNFGWDLRKLEQENKLRVLFTSPSLLLERDEEAGQFMLDEPVKEVGAKRVVIDSLSHFEMHVPEADIRKESYRLIMYLKTKGLSSLLTWESPQMIGTSYSMTDARLSFVVDSILLLRFVEAESSMKKVLAIMKMRGSDHDKRLREYGITAEGFQVKSLMSGYEGILTGVSRKVSETVEERLLSDFTRFIGPISPSVFQELKAKGLTKGNILNYVNELEEKKILKREDARALKQAVATVIG